MLKAQKTHLVTETDYHNKEERVKVTLQLPERFIRVFCCYSQLAGSTRQRWQRH